MKRVFIISSHPLFGKGIESLLRWEEGLSIVGHEASSTRALERIKALEPDVVILDCSDSDASQALTVMRLFKETSRPCVIGLDLADNTITIYHGEQRTIRDVRDFVEAVQDSDRAPGDAGFAPADTVDC